MINFQLPETPAEIGEAVRAANGRILAAREVVRKEQAILSAIQTLCDHPKKDYDNDPRGPSWTCKTCGYTQ